MYCSEFQRGNTDSQENDNLAYIIGVKTISTSIGCGQILKLLTTNKPQICKFHSKEKKGPTFCVKGFLIVNNCHGLYLIYPGYSKVHFFIQYGKIH